jgi:hypothetical protein
MVPNYREVGHRAADCLPHLRQGIDTVCAFP